jgi:hypothetical protein
LKKIGFQKLKPIPRKWIILIVIGIALFISGLYSDNKVAQSVGIVMAVGSETLNGILVARRDNYDFLATTTVIPKKLLKY